MGMQKEFSLKSCNNCNRLVRRSWRFRGEFLCYWCYHKKLREFHKEIEGEIEGKISKHFPEPKLCGECKKILSDQVKSGLCRECYQREYNKKKKERKL